MGKDSKVVVPFSLGKEEVLSLFRVECAW